MTEVIIYINCFPHLISLVINYPSHSIRLSYIHLNSVSFDMQGTLLLQSRKKWNTLVQESTQLETPRFVKYELWALPGAVFLEYLFNVAFSYIFAEYTPFVLESGSSQLIQNTTMLVLTC